jgi:hypothetical protein
MGSARGRATLADLDSFSRSYVNQLISAGKIFDCADLAIEVWIRFAEQHGIPVSFQYFDTKTRKYTPVRRNSFRTVEAFIRFVHIHVGAVDLIRNTYEVAGSHRAAVAGDVFLWKYISEVTGRQHPWGHTQILYEIKPGSGGQNTDQIKVVQGSLPKIVPRFETLPASYFYQSHPHVSLRMSNDLNARREPHTRVPVGNGPRRFKSFQDLR